VRVLEVVVAARVLVVSEHVGPLVEALRAAGLEPVSVPLVYTVGTGEPPPVAVPAQILVSSAAAPRLAPQLAAWCAGARVVAVGPATTRALQVAGITVAATGDSGGGQALALLDPALQPTVFVGARQPAPDLAQALSQGRLLHWAVYDRAEPDARAALAAAMPVQAAILSSPSAVEAWLRQRPPGAEHLPLVLIGPTTAAAAAQAGLAPLTVAASPRVEALVAATCQALGL